jgi:hypothetical protein
MSDEEKPEASRGSDKDVQEVREKLIYLEGFLRASKLWGAALLTLVLAWLGFNSFVQIPRAIEEHLEEEAKIQIEDAVNKIQSSGSLATRSANEARAKVQEAERLLSDARELLDRIQTNDDEGNNRSGGVRTYPLPENGDDQAGTTPAEPAKASRPEVVLFERSWAKANYFLSIEENLRLNVNNVDDTEVAISIALPPPGSDLASKTLSVNDSLEYVTSEGTKYTVTLLAIGDAGFNRRTKAGFFRVVRN